MFRKPLVLVVVLVTILLSSPGGSAAELMVGTATVDITPTEPVAVSGQFHLRIAKTVETPVTANVIALESRRDGLSRDVAIMVSGELAGAVVHSSLVGPEGGDALVNRTVNIINSLWAKPKSLP